MGEERSKPMDTVRLDAAAQKRLMDDLDRAGAAASAGLPAERRGIRVRYRPGVVPIEVSQPSGHVQQFAVLPRNLSVWGMGFVHGRFVYATSRIKAILPRLDGAMPALAGAVVNCRHLMGLLHEVAVRFDEPIDLTQFADLTDDAMRQATGDRAKLLNTRNVASVAMMIGDSSCDVLVSDLLRSGLALRRETDLHAVLAGTSRNGFAAIILQCTPQIAPQILDHVRMWRGNGFAGPVLLLTGIDDEELESQALDAGANVVIPPPHGATEVLGWLNRLSDGVSASTQGRQESVEDDYSSQPSPSLQSPPNAENVSSGTLPTTWPDPRALRENLRSGDPGLMQLVDAFFGALQQQADCMETACEENDFQTVAELCKVVELAGSQLGDEQLTRACRGTLSVLVKQSGEVEAVRRCVKDLLAQMRRKIP